MAIKTSKPTSPGHRHYSATKKPGGNKNQPVKSLIKGTIKKASGRNNTGKIQTEQVLSH